MQDVFMALVVFGSFFFIIRMFTNFLLKRRLIKGGHVEKANILEPTTSQEQEPQKMASLKWAMVSTMAGLGLIVAFVVGKYFHLDRYEIDRSLISFGIELMFIGMGFLFYFLLAIKQKQ